ncbi:hypothetical protein [Bifidobacterium pullorum]|uniref:hypothetical protein n=1 Tax=Bifidobacterium pullorum TaxID=78448 RepID=UPI00242A89EC|nr:hypothetical protein [Bifidobacterium pullorum]
MTEEPVNGDTVDSAVQPEATNARAREVWATIKRLAKDNFKRVFVSDDDDDDTWMLQSAVTDSERHSVTERVIFEPEADSVQIRIMYPFHIPPETLPFAQAYVSTEAFGMRFARVELDSDGDIICNCIIPYRVGDPFPEQLFVELLGLTARVGVRQYPKLKAYADGELDDDEIDAFLTWLPSARELVESRERNRQDRP